MKYFILTFILSFTTIGGMACVCIHNQETFEHMAAHSDIAFIGFVLSSDHFNPYVVESDNKERSGSDVIVRVDSVLKGDLQKGDLVYIFQKAGSCNATFEYSSTHLILGNQLLEISQEEPEYMDKAIPPGPLGLDSLGVYHINADSIVVDFLRDQIIKYTVVETDMCRSFEKGHRYFNQVLSQFHN